MRPKKCTGNLVFLQIVARSDKEEMMKRNEQKGNDEKTRKAIN